MSRVKPLDKSSIEEPVKHAFEEHVRAWQARITNMKATLGHSLVSFTAYMHWYPLYKEVENITGRRAAYLYAFAISTSSDCPLCSSFFRKIIIDAGEDPANLQLTGKETKLLEFGSSIARNHGHIPDNIYNPLAEIYSDRELVVLIAFAGQMIATNVFNNVIETDIDDYLLDYLQPLKSASANVQGSER